MYSFSDPEALDTELVRAYLTCHWQDLVEAARRKENIDSEVPASHLTVVPYPVHVFEEGELKGRSLVSTLDVLVQFKTGEGEHDYQQVVLEMPEEMKRFIDDRLCPANHNWWQKKEFVLTPETMHDVAAAQTKLSEVGLSFLAVVE